MTDLHTHILPGMDDGAVDAAMSLVMLQRERAQRVRRVALTPHYYMFQEEPSDFLKRREIAWETLQREMEREKDDLPEIMLGAEVTWQVCMPGVRDLERLCYQGTRYLLLELPMERWTPRLIGALHSLMHTTGLIPVLAHIDRYLPYQEDACIQELLSMGIPLQFSAEALMHYFPRRRCMCVMTSCQLPLLISDCHNLTNRPPNIAMGMEMCAAHFSRDMIARLVSATDSI